MTKKETLQVKFAELKKCVSIVEDAEDYLRAGIYSLGNSSIESLKKAYLITSEREGVLEECIIDLDTIVGECEQLISDLGDNGD